MRSPSPAPQPAPLRPGQRNALALLDKPGAHAVTFPGTSYLWSGVIHDVSPVRLRALHARKLLADKSGGRGHHCYTITPAGRAALRAGSRGGGRGRAR